MIRASRICSRRRRRPLRLRPRQHRHRPKVSSTRAKLEERTKRKGAGSRLRLLLSARPASERPCSNSRQTFSSMPSLAIVGLGPSDSSLLTLGALDRLRNAPRTAVSAAPPALVEYLKANGVNVVAVALEGAALSRGVTEAIQSVVEFARTGDAALGVPGHPMLDFPGLPHLLRALEAANIEVQ